MYDFRGCIGIAGAKSIDWLPKAYHKAVMLTGYYVLSDRIQVIDEAFLQEKSSSLVREPEREQILAYVRGDKEVSLEESINKLLNNLTSYHIKTANKYLNELITDVLRIYENALDEKYEEYEIYLDDFLTNEILIGGVDARDCLKQLFLQVKAQVQAGYKSASTKVMNEVLIYIEDNYSDPGISVQSVAEFYGLSVSYFSKLFNRYTGKSFPDYICQMRLKQAHKLLIDYPNMEISEISRHVGFNSSSYFAATYRKYYGVSPSQNRRSKDKCGEL